MDPFFVERLRTHLGLPSSYPFVSSIPSAYSILSYMKLLICMGPAIAEITSIPTLHTGSKAAALSTYCNWQCKFGNVVGSDCTETS